VSPPPPIARPPAESPEHEPAPIAAPAAVASSPPAAPAAAAGAGKGELLLQVFPWGRARVDGRPVGTAPFGPIRLRAGPHVVEVENPDRGKATRWVRIQPDRRTIVRIVLEDR